jgi:peptidyl-prolyl cis-trans isomerase D
MSIIQSIRDRGAWIIGGVIALALIAFVLQDGFNRGGSLNGNNSTLAQVNGVSIDKKDFDKKLDAATQGNSQQREQMINQMYAQEVNQILLSQEFDKLGLACPPKQLDLELFKPSSQLMNEFKNPETGQVDEEKARQAFAQFKKSKNEAQKQSVYEFLIKPTILQAKYAKYNSLFSQAAYAPKWLIAKQQADNAAFASVSYVAVPYSSIADSTIKVSDDEILAYANKHSKEYEKEDETRSIQFVTFDAVPSANDSAAVKTKVETLKNEMLATNDMKLFFAKNSTEIPYLGSYIAGNKIQQPVKDSLFKLSVGQTYGPYIDVKNYVVAKMVGIKSIPDSAKVRHILVETNKRDPKTGQPYRFRDDSSAKHIMDTIEMALKSGKSFDSVCLKYSEDPGSNKKGGVYDYFPSGQMVTEFNNFVFTNSTGKSGVVLTEFGYHYIEILGQKGSSVAYDIAYMAKEITISNETDVAVKTEAAKFLSEVKDRKAFDEKVASLKKISMPSGDIKKEDFTIQGLGSNRNLVRWIYKNKVGDITDQYYESNNKYVIAVIASINKPGVPSAISLKPTVESLVKNEKKANQLLTKIKGTTLEAMATSAGNGTSVQKIDTLPANNAFNPILGNDNKFAGLAFNVANKGKVSEVIAGQNGVFAIRVDNIAAKPSTMDDAITKQMLTNTIKSTANRAVESLRKSASIKDNRADLF